MSPRNASVTTAIREVLPKRRPQARGVLVAGVRSCQLVLYLCRSAAAQVPHPPGTASPGTRLNNCDRDCVRNGSAPVAYWFFSLAFGDLVCGEAVGAGTIEGLLVQLCDACR
jgi:hypothetical protein